LDIAWLAGMLNGDGCFSLQVRKRKERKNQHAAQVDLSLALTQTDGVIIEKAKIVMEKITEATPHIVEYAPSGAGKNTKLNLRYSKMAHIKKLLEAIEPFLVGNKAARARLIMAYINRRLSMTDVATRNKNPLHDKTSWQLIKKYYSSQNKDFPKDIQAIPRG